MARHLYNPDEMVFHTDRSQKLDKTEKIVGMGSAWINE